MKILVCADFHGNTDMIDQLDNIIKQHNIDIFCYIGDIQQMRSAVKIDKNEEYIDRTFYSQVAKLNIQSYVIPGNTDYRFIVDHMKQKYQNTNLHIYTDGGIIKFDQFDLILYPRVPYSHHCLKEFEGFQKTRQPSKSDLQATQSFIKKQFDYKDNTAVFAEDCILYEQKFFDVYKNYESLPEQYKKQLNHTIYDDIQQFIQQTDKDKMIILLTHAPPFNTVGDVVDREKQIHVGCQDIRQVIEENPQIKINVSGHIHQSVQCSLDQKTYKSIINQKDNKQCICATLGNSGIDSDYAKQLNYVVIDTETLSVERFTLQLQNCKFPYTFRRF